MAKDLPDSVTVVDVAMMIVAKTIAVGNKPNGTVWLGRVHYSTAGGE